MSVKKEWVAMLLAGGQGSRLHPLTKTTAKPAVPFGGKYRIIDFPLSNCVNSGIDTVGVLTQYQPLTLTEHLGNGQPWDLNRLDGGVFVLPPYRSSSGSGWYTGTANAVCQNIPFVERYSPEYVLVLSGDHIYKMDYAGMLAHHRKTGADCTIAVIGVPKEEAPRFGIVTVRPDTTIREFEEKPARPRSTLASMGVYIFSWEKLKKYLREDSADPGSANDFGKNIIPNMLKAGEKLVAYAFDGYWKDVGTIDSLWEANMDFLDPNIPMDLYDSDWRIFSRNACMPPHHIAESAKVQNSMVAEGCTVAGNVDFSILFAGVTVGEGAVVDSSILMPGASVEAGAEVHFAIVAEDASVRRGAYVGERPELMGSRDEWGVTVVGAGVTVGENVRVKARERVETDRRGAG